MKAPNLVVALLCCAATAAAMPMNAGALVAPAAARRTTPPLALVLPPDSIAEIVVVEGGLNFLALYQGLITIRILLSWFPQAQGVALLQPVFTVSEADLNLFRGIVPPIGGIDISPIGAFFVLNLLQSSVASLATPLGAKIEVKQPPGS